MLTLTLLPLQIIIFHFSCKTPQNNFVPKSTVKQFNIILQRSWYSKTFDIIIGQQNFCRIRCKKISLWTFFLSWNSQSYNVRVNNVSILIYKCIEDSFVFHNVHHLIDFTFKHKKVRNLQYTKVQQSPNTYTLKLIYTSFLSFLSWL